MAPRQLCPAPSRSLAPGWHGDGGNVVTVDKVRRDNQCNDAPYATHTYTTTHHPPY